MSFYDFMFSYCDLSTMQLSRNLYIYSVLFDAYYFSLLFPSIWLRSTSSKVPLSVGVLVINLENISVRSSYIYSSFALASSRSALYSVIAMISVSWSLSYKDWIW